MSPEHHPPRMTAFVGGNGSGRKTNRRWGREKAGSRCWWERRGVWGRSGQAGGWLGWRVAPRMPYGARPGSGPQAPLTGPGRELGQRKCPWQDATTRGSSCAHGQCCPALGLTAPLAGWPKPGPQALLSPLPHCPVCGQALGFAPPSPLSSFPQAVIRGLLGYPGSTQGTGVGAANRPILPQGASLAHLRRSPNPQACTQRCQLRV